MKTLFSGFLFFFMLLLLSACKQTSEASTEKVVLKEKPVNKGLELIQESLEKTGDYRQLRSKKDVIYTYTYTTPDGKTDRSTEKYKFDGEYSYGHYQRHDRTFPELDGLIEQGFDGKNYWLKHNGKAITDTAAIKRVKFTRPTNFYWFAMFQKLEDPGLNYDYLGEQVLQDITYEVVKVSFESDAKPQDIYQIYINKETKLIDQFLFTVAEYGVTETPLLMQVEYENVEGLLIPSKRQYKRSDWKASVGEGPWVKVSWKDIRFNNGLTREEFRL